MTTHALHFLNYNTWANNRVFEHLQQLPAGISHQEIQSTFPSVFDTLLHIYMIDKGWHSVLLKEYASNDYEAITRNIAKLQKETSGLDLKGLLKLYQALAAGLSDFTRQHNMQEIHTFSSVPMSYEDVFHHIVNHGTYHRGNISAMLHQLGHAGTPTDYGLYMYMLSFERKE